ncbi:MAG: hypothetical protein Q8911_00175 [Bacillota bacterium]|nr:hypothetical protein [Bacillota bacterium]
MDAAEIAIKLMFNLLKLVGFIWVCQQIADITGQGGRFMKVIWLIGGVTFALIGYQYVSKFMAIAGQASKGIWQ